MNIKNGEIYIDRQKGPNIFFIKYFGTILFISCIMIFVVSVLDDGGGENTKRTLYIIIAFIILGFVFERFIRRIACKIVIDFNSNTVCYSMCRGNKVKEYEFSSIKSINLKRYATFKFEEETIIYNIVDHEDLKAAIQRIKMGHKRPWRSL